MLLLTGAATTASYAQTILSPLQEAIRIALGLTDNQMALLQGPATALPLAIAGVPLGVLIDRYSRVRFVVLFAALNIVGNLLTALAPNLIVLFGARCIVGLAVPGITIAALSMIADLYEPAQRGRAFMVLTVGQVAGMSAAFALGGRLLSAFDATPDAWRWAMVWLTGPLVVLFCLLLAAREPVRSGVVVDNPSFRAAFVELWRYRTVLVPLLSGLILISIANAASLLWTAPALSRDFGLAPAQIGTIMATALLISGLAGPVAGGLLVDYCQRTGGPRRAISVVTALAFASAPTALYSAAPSSAAAVTLLVIFLTLSTTIIVMASPVCTVVVPNEIRGLCISLIGALTAPFSFGLAPILVSSASTAMGGPAMIGRALGVVGLLISILGGAVFAVGQRSTPARVE